METITVTLPSGKKIRNVPKGTSKEVLKDKLISNGKATLADFEIAEEAPVPEIPVPSEFPVNPRRRGSTVRPSESSLMEDTQQFLRENMGLPVGIAGGIAGAIGGGMVGGPPGAIAGGVLMSGVGTGYGTLLSDDIAGEERDYGEAIQEAFKSMGIDIATLGLAKPLKAGYLIAKKKLGFSPKEAAEQILKEVEPVVGSKASLQASQEILEGAGATLTPSQVGATGFELMKEKLARSGLLSSGRFEENAANVNKAVQEGLSEVVNRMSVRTSGSPMEIAEELTDLIDLGRQSLITRYGDGLDALAKIAPSSTQVGLGKHVAAIDRFLAQRTKGGISELYTPAQEFIEQTMRPLVGNNLSAKTTLDGLFTLDKRITNEIKQRFGTKGSPTHNPDAERQLAQLAKEMREATYNSLSKVNPELASKYKALKSDFSEGISGLLPDINKDFVKKANEGHYSALGNILSTAGNPSKILAFKRSLKEAFKQIDKAGKEAGQFMAYEEAESLLKRAFIERQFPNLYAENFSVEQYANLAKRLSNKGEQDRFKAVLGESYPQVKQLVNLMSEASVKPSGNIGELMLRHKEFAAMAQAGAGYSLGGFLGSAGVLLIPKFLANAATNPKHVNKLIAFDKANFKDTTTMETALSVVVGDIIATMSDEQQAEIRNSIRDSNAQ